MRRFLRAKGLDELLAKTTSHVTLLVGFESYLLQRWNEGCTDAARLFAEIRDAGYRGSALTVRRYLCPFRATGTAPQQAPAKLKVREVVGWIMREPGRLKADEQGRFPALLGRCRELNALAGHVRVFAEMIREPRGDRLQQWMDEVEADDLPALHSFVAGLRRDQDAVLAGLTRRWTTKSEPEPGFAPTFRARGSRRPGPWQHRVKDVCKDPNRPLNRRQIAYLNDR